MRLLIAILLAFCLGVGSVAAWGPITHLEIAEMQDGTSNDYRAGAILPDYSLAYRAAYDSSYPDLQSVTHSQAFRDALSGVASDDFLAGWDSHLYADSIETPYSRSMIQQGAPTSADYVVDQAYALSQKHNCPNLSSGYIAQRYVNWITHALNAVGCDIPYPPSSLVAHAYAMYVSGSYQPNKAYYNQVLEEWYQDYEEYVYLSAGVPVPPSPKPPSPVPPLNPLDYYQFSYSVGLSHSEVQVGEQFFLNITTDLRCIKDLPFGIRTVTGAFDIMAGPRILASHAITINNFPDWAGDTAHIDESIPLSLAEAGTHTIIAQITGVSIDKMDATAMVPYTSMPIGVVVCVGEPVPPEPVKPKIATRVTRPWYAYEAPPERAEAERLKTEKWTKISAQMRTTDDIAEKLRLYAEWEAFRDAHTTPSTRI